MTVTSGLQLITLAAIWGSSFLFMKVAVPVFGPAALIEIRLLLAALLLAAVASVSRRPLDWNSNWRHHFVIGGINSAIPFLCFAYAAQTLPASLLSLFNSLAPIFGALVSAIVLRTPVTRKTSAGLASGVAGVALLSCEHILNTPVSTKTTELALATGAAAFAPLCYGIAATYIKWSSHRVDAFSNAHGAMWSATLIAAPLALSTPPSGDITPLSVGAVVVLGLVCTGAAYLLQFKLFADLGPTRGLTVTYLIPVFGVLWGGLFLDEPVGWTLVAGGALILLGTALVMGGFTSRTPPAAPDQK